MRAWRSSLIDLFDGRAASRIVGRRSTARHAASSRHATSTTSHLLENRHGNTFQGLLLLLILLLFSSRVAVQPADGIINLGLGLVSRINLSSNFLSTNGRLERVAVVLQSILGLNAVAVGIIFS